MDNVWIDNDEISQGCIYSDSVCIDSLVCGQCRIFGHALIDQHSMIVAAQITPTINSCSKFMIAQGLAPRVLSTRRLWRCRRPVCFGEHRAEVFDFASIEGNEENNVWLATICAKVYGHAQVKAGIEEDAIPTIHYGSRWRNMPLWKVIVC